MNPFKKKPINCLNVGNTVIFKNKESALVLICSKTSIKYLKIDGYDTLCEPLSNYNDDLTHTVITRLDIVKVIKGAYTPIT